MPKIVTAIPLSNHVKTNQFIHKNPKIPPPETETTIKKADNKLNNTSKQCQAFTTNDSFVRLNLRNSAGSCRSARNLKSRNCQKR